MDSASGIHPRFSEYYIRRVRADNKDPLALFMQDNNFPCEPDVMKPDTGLVFSFPMKAPEGAQLVEDATALNQLKLWKLYQDHWCEHKPSVTIYYTDEEFLEVGDWLFKNFDDVSGISFLPHDGGTYQQTPYEKISKGEYEDMLADMPKGTDWEGLASYEEDDNTTGGQTLACTGGVCEVVDLN